MELTSVIRNAGYARRTSAKTRSPMNGVSRIVDWHDALKINLHTPAS